MQFCTLKIYNKWWIRFNILLREDWLCICIRKILFLRYLCYIHGATQSIYVEIWVQWSDAETRLSKIEETEMPRSDEVRRSLGDIQT